uniref:Uncharacterized protein n=1 Tax=Romanomermis culicivorax TaxID=13658 RepID=A0A915L089_ROMCU
MNVNGYFEQLPHERLWPCIRAIECEQQQSVVLTNTKQCSNLFTKKYKSLITWGEKHGFAFRIPPSQQGDTL